MPNIPPDIKTNIEIDRKGIVDLLLISIALEELSLAHIVNAEGELMQLYLKEIENNRHLNKEEIIKLNRSVSDTLRLVLEKEQTLKEKLRYVIQFHEDNDF